MPKQRDPIPPGRTPLPLTEGFLTAKEAAERMDLSVEPVRAMCSDGTLSGAMRKQGRWYVPLNAVEGWSRRQRSCQAPKVVTLRTGSGFSSPSKGTRSTYPVAAIHNHPWVFYPTTVISALIILVGVLFGLIQGGTGERLQTSEGGGLVGSPSEHKGETLIVIAQFYHSEGIADTEAHNEIRNAIDVAAQEWGNRAFELPCLLCRYPQTTGVGPRS